MEIESDVPIPKRGIGRPRKYPFPDMKVGDSFAVPLGEARTTKRGYLVTYRIAQAAKVYQRRHGGKFIAHSVTDKNEARCWRVE
jgi:hypothetical protein